MNPNDNISYYVDTIEEAWSNLKTNVYPHNNHVKPNITPHVNIKEKMEANTPLLNEEEGFIKYRDLAIQLSSNEATNKIIDAKISFIPKEEKLHICKVVEAMLRIIHPTKKLIPN